MNPLIRPLLVAALTGTLLWSALAPHANADEATPEAFVRKMETLLRVDGQPSEVVAALRKAQDKYASNKQWAGAFLNVAESIVLAGHTNDAKAVLIEIAQKQASVLSPQDKTRLFRLLGLTLTPGDVVRTSIGMAVGVASKSGSNAAMSPLESKIRELYAPMDTVSFRTLEREKKRTFEQAVAKRLPRRTEAVRSVLAKVVLDTPGDIAAAAAKHLVSEEGESVLTHVESILASGDKQAAEHMLSALPKYYTGNVDQLFAWAKRVVPDTSTKTSREFWRTFFIYSLRNRDALMGIVQAQGPYSDLALEVALQSEHAPAFEACLTIVRSKDPARATWAARTLLDNTNSRLNPLQTMSHDDLQVMLRALQDDLSSSDRRVTHRVWKLLEAIIDAGGEAFHNNRVLLWRAAVPLDLATRPVPKRSRTSTRSSDLATKLRQRLGNRDTIPAELVGDDAWLDNYMTRYHGGEVRPAIVNLSMHDGIATRVIQRLKALPLRWRPVAVEFIYYLANVHRALETKISWGEIVSLEGIEFPSTQHANLYRTACRQRDLLMIKRIEETVPTLNLEQATNLIQALAAADNDRAVVTFESWIKSRDDFEGRERYLTRALGEMTVDSSLELLRRLAAHRESRWAPPALRALGKRGDIKSLSDAWALAANGKIDPRSDLHDALIDAARKTKHPASLPYLIYAYEYTQYTNDAGSVIDLIKEHRQRLAAAKRMMNDVDEETTKQLFEMLDAEDAGKRRAAVLALVGMGAKEALPRLAIMSTSDPDPDVRRVAMRGLEVLAGVLKAPDSPKTTNDK